MVMKILNFIALILSFIGGINWGLVGIFDWNLVSAIFGPGQNVGSVIIYCLVLLATLWLLISAIINKGKIDACLRKENK